MNRFLSLSLSFLGLLMLFSSCKVRRPQGVPDDDEMANLLYDYHMAKSVEEAYPYGEDGRRADYLERVFAKHHIDAATFDSSLVWYSRQTGRLVKIYEKVMQRMRDKQAFIAQQSDLLSQTAFVPLAGDSIDIWPKQHLLRFSSHTAESFLTFDLPGDSTFLPGDSLVWSAEAVFVGRGRADSLSPMLLLTLEMANAKDTVRCSRAVQMPGRMSLGLKSDSLSVPTQVRGFVAYLPTSEQAQPPIFLSDINLYRYHPQVKTDSLSAAFSTDSATVVTDSLGGASPSGTDTLLQVAPDTATVSLSVQPVHGTSGN